MSADSFSAIKEVFPTLRAVLSYSDQRLVEYVALCVIPTIESFARGATELLEGSLSEGVVKDIMNLLVPVGLARVPVLLEVLVGVEGQ
jgi:E3 ubiquitin-protein ligase TRIP12